MNSLVTGEPGNSPYEVWHGMMTARPITDWMAERGIDGAGLAESAGLDPKVVEAIVHGRYTTSPRQRQKLADALNVAPEAIRWGQAVPVDHMYGHGPQFGRSP